MATRITVAMITKATTCVKTTTPLVDTGMTAATIETGTILTEIDMMIDVIVEMIAMVIVVEETVERGRR